MNSLWALVKETAIVLLAEQERGREIGRDAPRAGPRARRTARGTLATE